MSDFLGVKDSFVKSEPQSSINSGTVSADSASPPSNNMSKLQSLNIPNMNIKTESGDKFLSRSLDIKKQLSSSFQGTPSHGGITKPQSRRNSAYAIKSNDGSEDGSDDEEDDNNNNGSGNNKNKNEEQGHERKRRDNINDKIQELLTLVPPEFFQETHPSNVPQPSNQSEHDAAIAAAVKNSGTKDGKPNKGQILSKSVEYLQYLQNLIDENNRKEVELIMKLKKLQMKESGQSNIPINVGHTSAERALGEIGVGPLSDEYFKKVLQSSSKRSNAVGSP
ncbi:hypothetical protein CAAN1_04S05512 [[Candida] anglica]|uniref:BHLH domain-containing protein n=1 Tax=[Candida] anglica TaxID=148631 RepID=A0ABP0E8L2_9ASCO